ncbi:MAG: ABC-type transport auxiliary lipoprotein family protein [Pseudomonadota bacterium]
MMRLVSARHTISALGLLIMTGCISVLPEPVTPEALYRPQAVSVSPALTQSIVVRETESPQIFAGQAMISEDGAGALRLVPQVQWAGRSTRLIQLALTDSFANTVDSAALLPEIGVQAPYELTTRIRTLVLRGDEAVCEISASIISSMDRSVVDQTIVSASSLANTSNNSDRAVALRTATEGCVAEIALFTEVTLQKEPVN